VSKDVVRYCSDFVVRGYHVYKDIWEATRGEVLTCARETGNVFDPFAVSVLKGYTVAGHVPRKISAICSLFIQRGGMIRCKVTGSRQYSSDISQGGLEIPCLLIFMGDSKYIEKVKKAMSSASATGATKSKVTTGKATKEVVGKVEVKNKDLVTEMKAPKRAKMSTGSSDNRQQTSKEVDQDANLEWVRIFNIVLKISDG